MPAGTTPLSWSSRRPLVMVITLIPVSLLYAALLEAGVRLLSFKHRDVWCGVVRV